jgi:DNA-binding MarR family transcriptional regulator
VRRFNRLVTQRVGALTDRYLAQQLSLGEARVLWEIGYEGCEVRSLRARLGLDPAYLSRVVRSLEERRLVRITPAARDRRIRFAELTKRGIAERARLDERSDELASSMLAGLAPEDRAPLIEAMRTVARLLAKGAIEVRAVDPRIEDARFCIESYFAELSRRSNGGFDRGAAISAEPHELVPPQGNLLIAYRGAEPVGCGAVKYHPGEPCEIKRMWVAESARGAGIGRWLLERLETLAIQNGATVAHIETNATLVEAISLYKDAGYVEVPRFNDEPFADHWFEKQLEAA